MQRYGIYLPVLKSISHKCVQVERHHGGGVPSGMIFWGVLPSNDQWVCATLWDMVFRPVWFEMSYTFCLINITNKKFVSAI